MKRTKPPIDGGRVLITGASAGIGGELARQLASRAGVLILVARRRERLEELRGELVAKHPRLEVDLEPCDLGDPAAVEALCARVLERRGGVDVLVNNAGLGDLALYEQADWRRIEQIIRVNVTAPALLTHRFLPGMVKIPSEQCVREALAGFERGEALVLPGRSYRLAMAAQAMAPRAVRRRMARGLAAQLRRRLTPGGKSR